MVGSLAGIVTCVLGFAWAYLVASLYEKAWPTPPRIFPQTAFLVGWMVAGVLLALPVAALLVLRLGARRAATATQPNAGDDDLRRLGKAAGWLLRDPRHYLGLAGVALAVSAGLFALH